MRLWATITAVTASCMVLAGCGGNENSESPGESAVEVAGEGPQREEALRNRWRSLDSVPPTVSILGQSTIASSGLVQLTGVAADNRRLYRVRWSNDRGGRGTATLSGTALEAAWTAAQIQLQVGINTITVTAGAAHIVVDSYGDVLELSQIKQYWPSAAEGWFNASPQQSKLN